MVGQVLRWEGRGQDVMNVYREKGGREGRGRRKGKKAELGRGNIALGSRELRIEFSPCILITSSV